MNQNQNNITPKKSMSRQIFEEIKSKWSKLRAWATRKKWPEAFSNDHRTLSIDSQVITAPNSRMTVFRLGLRKTSKGFGTYWISKRLVKDKPRKLTLIERFSFWNSQIWLMAYKYSIKWFVSPLIRIITFSKSYCIIIRNNTLKCNSISLNIYLYSAMNHSLWLRCSP